MTLNNQSNDSELLKRAGGDALIKLMEGYGFHLTQTEANRQGYWFKESEPQMTIGLPQAKTMFSILQGEILKARIDELRNFDPFFKGDHSKCPDKMTCIGYQNAQCDFENECEIRVSDLQSQLTKLPKEEV